jgi:hypothetical protein
MISIRGLTGRVDPVLAWFRSWNQLEKKGGVFRMEDVEVVQTEEIVAADWTAT